MDKTSPAIQNQWIFILMVFGLLISSWVEANQYEKEIITLSASAILAENIRIGPNYRVSEKVVNEGFMNHYTIESDFGVFNASSDEQLLIRIREIAAIAELKSQSKTDVFTQAVGQAAQKPVAAIQKVIEQPVETIKGVPVGASRLFKRAARKIKDAGEKVGEYATEKNQQSEAETGQQKASSKEVLDKGVEEGKEFTRGQLGHSSAIRKLSKKLNVDPYSSNAVLQEQMSDVAWVMAAGSLTTGLIMPSMPGELSGLSDINEVVWSKDPIDLRLMNEALLKEMGVSEKLTKLFFDNRYFTVSMQTRLIGLLTLVSGAKGKPILLEHAADAESREEARLFGQIAETLMAYHQSKSPIVRILDNAVLPMAESKSGNLIFIAPLDYFSWTQSSSEVSVKLTEELEKVSSNSEREVWVQGNVSEMARTNLNALGWVVFDQSKRRLQ
jgi:hypothetical protein